MEERNFKITLEYEHRIRFTRDVFAEGNRMLARLLQTNGHAKVLVFLEQAVAAEFPQLESQIHEYFESTPGLQLKRVVVAPGAEECKRDEAVLHSVWDAVNEEKIDRHSYVFAIGGGAFLDVIGFGAATAHRGIRLVRFPTTTLSQDDSGVGVKNGINAFGKKNWLGSFTVPYAVVNDFAFLHSQPAGIRRDGLVEAVKVALVRDGAFFEWLEDNAGLLKKLKPHALEEAVERSAILHAEHIAFGGDPYELGSSRPLDFGHWAAHKLEQLTGFALSHAQAVSVGIALDSIYSWKTGRLQREDAQRILKILSELDLPLYHEGLEIEKEDGNLAVFDGLEEFREHLGGELTVLLLKGVGEGEDVHFMDTCLLKHCIGLMKAYANEKSESLRAQLFLTD
ncbi:3-dehydroquinate synthase [Rubritalea marina]|uniref:3-dehydroquinate synthase n=1 Tax=Rubritalea marina TaxID=361055 RepID=UPI000380A7ED|nr:3-dehydroquinate synthase [Rubritalea marina]